MDALKKFLGKKKSDAKFKMAGPGQKLSDDGQRGQLGAGSSGGPGGGRPQEPHHSKKQQQQQHRQQQVHHHHHPSEPTDEKIQAARAALQRLEKSKPNAENLLNNRRAAVIREQAKKELEAERKQMEEASGATGVRNTKARQDFTLEPEGRVIDPESYAVAGVFFTCPIIGPEVSAKIEIEERIKSFLKEQPIEEIGVTSCLLIHSCNKGFEKINYGVETLCKYLDNILSNPDDPKFQKIKISNKVFQGKVANLEGAPEFLEASGFIRQFIDKEDGTDEKEEYWVFSPSFDKNDVVGHLTELRDTLKCTTPIRPELDRNLQVLMPAQVQIRKELPEEFYTLTIDEMKREQKLKSEIAEQQLTLRTKAQRERDEQREQRLYRYAVIRIRFPDGLYLQGTFHAREKLSELFQFVHENLVDESIEFSLKKSGGDVLDALNSTLSENNLPPASVINFRINSNLEMDSYLKPEILALIQGMENATF